MAATKIGRCDGGGRAVVVFAGASLALVFVDDDDNDAGDVEENDDNRHDDVDDDGGAVRINTRELIVERTALMETTTRIIMYGGMGQTSRHISRHIYFGLWMHHDTR